MAICSTPSVNMLTGMESEQGRNGIAVPCLTSPPPIPPKVITKENIWWNISCFNGMLGQFNSHIFFTFQPQINNLAYQPKPKLEFNSDGRRNTSIHSNADGQSVPPRKAISTIALNYETGWNHKSSLDSHPLKGNNYCSQ